MTYLTVNINVGKKVHFDLNDSIALARFTTSALNVKTKASFIVSAHFSLICLGKKAANIIKYSSIRCGVASRRPANRRLVNVNYLIKIFNPGNFRVLSWFIG